MNLLKQWEQEVNFNFGDFQMSGMGLFGHVLRMGKILCGENVDKPDLEEHSKQPGISLRGPDVFKPIFS